VTRKLGYHKKELVWKFMEDVCFLWLYDYPRPYWWSLKVDNAEMLGGRPSKMGLVENPHDRECGLCRKYQFEDGETGGTGGTKSIPAAKLIRLQPTPPWLPVHRLANRALRAMSSHLSYSAGLDALVY
jgi:hypothetical protein